MARDPKSAWSVETLVSSKRVQPIHRRSAEAGWVNPYARLVDSFRNELFVFDDFDADRARMREKVGNERVWVELGSGSGSHLLQQAQLHPDILCVGFEMRYKRAVRTVQKAQEIGPLKNLAVALTDARLVGEIFGPASVDRVFVNFPDPWEKSRWEKHRLLSAPLFEALEPVLVPGGSLRVKTDHRKMFEQLLQAGEEQTSFQLLTSTFDLHRSEHCQDNVLTEFESLFLSQGLPICFCEYIFQNARSETLRMMEKGREHQK